MRDKNYYIKKICSSQSNFAIWWATYVPSFLLFLSLIWLITTSLRTLSNETLSRELVVFYLTGIAITLSIASASFSYARVADDSLKKQIVGAGEYFLYAAISLIIALMINWFVVEVRQLLDKFISSVAIKLIPKATVAMFVGISYFYVGVAATDVARGFWELDNILSKKTFR